LRKFVITKKEFPCRERGEEANARPWRAELLNHNHPACSVPGGEPSTFLNYTLEIRSGRNLDCAEGLISKLDVPPC